MHIGGAGNFPYTPRALSKRPVTLDAPQGREVDFRKQGVSRTILWAVGILVVDDGRMDGWMGFDPDYFCGLEPFF